MALPTMQYQQSVAAQRFANALYNTQAGSETLNYVLDDFNAYGKDDVLNSYYAFSYGATSVADVTAMLLANLNVIEGQYGIDDFAYTSAYDYVYDTLSAAPVAARGVVVADIVDFWVTFDNPYYTDAIAAFNDEIQTAMEYTGTVDVEVGTANTVTTDFYLTSGQDIVVGTARADYFHADLAQNAFAGGVSNTLSSGDVLDGGAGHDVLNANLVPEFFGASGDNHLDIQPRIKNIETIELQAQDYHGQIGNQGTDTTVYFDAKNVTDVQKIGSYYSDGNLVIENLTTLTNSGVERNTSAITVTMDHTDNTDSDGHASDLTVLFDDDYLLSGKTANSFVEYWLLDQDADMNNTDVDGDGAKDLLANINANGIRFTVNGGEELVLAFDHSLLLNSDVITHAQFVAALQAPLQDMIAAGLVPADTTVFLDPNSTKQTYLDNGARSSLIPAITIQTQTTDVFKAVGFAWVEDMVGDYNVYGRMNDDATESNEPVSVNIDLHKVGRAGDGGNLIIGGKYQGWGVDYDHMGNDDGKGISDFHVNVIGDKSKPSDLGVLSSTNGALNNVYISTDASADGIKGYASLTIRDGFNGGWINGVNATNNSLNLVDANNFRGDLFLGSDLFLGDIYGDGQLFNTGTAVQNLTTLSAHGGGDVTFIGALVEGNGIASGNAYSYSTGSGADTIVVDLDGDAVDAIGESLAINTGAGDDVVVINSIQGVSQRTMQVLDNLSINTGAGADQVVINGYQNFDINAGSGSDFVYLSSLDYAGINGGFFNADATAATGVWAFGSTTGPAAFADRVLYNATLTVTFAGFESKVSVATNAAGKFVADQGIINAAIISAIERSPELSQLLETDLRTGDQQLVVNSLVDGANQLDIKLAQPTLVPANVNAGDRDALLQGIIATDAAQNSMTDAVGYVNGIAGQVNQSGTTGVQFLTPNTGGSANATDVDSLNYSRVNMGDGANDLLVLNSNVNSANIIEINQAFGKVSVVNYFDDAARTVVGNHLIDYSHYLSNQTDASNNNNNWSARDINITLNGDATAEANSVSMLTFNGTLANSISWASFSGSDLLAALNGTATNVIGGLVDGDLDAVANTTNLIGNVQDHIVMVENNSNKGEYKVFYLTSEVNSTTNTTGGDFASANLLGTLDFGNSINFPLWGNAADVANYNNLIKIADGVAPGPVDPDPVDPDAPVTDVTVLDLETYDASTGAFNYILDYSVVGVKLANINGFGDDDTVTITNGPTGATTLFDSSSASSIDFAYGDLAAFSNAWVIQMGALDVELVTDVVDAADVAAQQAVLDTAWGDWLVA
ncbi:MAG: hypothetical protein RBR43_07040 [Desulfuromonadaceae bacterium]|nr:hypothetical protein [Desulfuromonadaceae bacterium]